MVLANFLLNSDCLNHALVMVLFGENRESHRPTHIYIYK